MAQLIKLAEACRTLLLLFSPYGCSHIDAMHYGYALWLHMLPARCFHFSCQLMQGCCCRAADGVVPSVAGDTLLAGAQ